MRAVKSVTIDSERRVIITFLDGSTETLYPNCIWCDLEALRQLIKDLLEEKADAIVQTINNVTVATFADGADEALIRKLLVSIEPIQEGSGDPSPENVRPISGRTGLNVIRCGKNLIYNPFTSGTYRGLTIESNNTAIHISGSYTYQNNNVFHLTTLLLKAGSYTLSGMPAGSNSEYGLRIQVWSENGTIGYDEGNKLNFRLSSDTTIYIRLFINGSTAYNKPVDIQANMMLALFESEYEEAKGVNRSVNWETEAGTVYGGYVDVISGKLTVDRGYIASYNGEALPSTWISDRDVYAEGTTPTTGAQVVYKLAESIEYQLEGQDITTLLGTNNIWADSGDILELEYVADTKLYIGESQSGTLGSGRQTISNPDLQPVSEKTVEDLTEAVKTETAEKETQEETVNERGE